MALAESNHHAAQRGQNHTATIRETPLPLPELSELSFDEELGGTRPDRFAGVRPQEQAQRHTVEQIVDTVPGLPTLDAPVPLMVEQLVDVLRFFDACCRAGYRLVVLYGYQGADTDAEQLALTEQLFDAAMGELGVVARESSFVCLVGDFNVEPTKIPCLAKRDFGWALGFIFEASRALAAGLHPAPTCKRDWRARNGHRRDFMVGCPLAAAAVLSCRVQPDRWIASHFAVRALFDSSRVDLSGYATPCRALPFGLLLGCLLLIRIGFQVC